MKTVFHLSFWSLVMLVVVLMHGAYDTILSRILSDGLGVLYVAIFGMISFMYVQSSHWLLYQKGYGSVYLWMHLLGPLGYAMILVLPSRNAVVHRNLLDWILGSGVVVFVCLLAGYQLAGNRIYGDFRFIYEAPDPQSDWMKISDFSEEGLILEDGTIVPLGKYRFRNVSDPRFREAFNAAIYPTPMSDLYIRKNEQGEYVLRLRNWTMHSYLFFFPKSTKENAYYEDELESFFAMGILSNFRDRTENDSGPNRD